MTGSRDDRVSWLLRPDHPEWVRAGALAWLETGDPLHLCLDLDRARHVRAFLCISPVRINLRTYAPGDEIRLSPDETKTLLKSGSVKRIERKSAHDKIFGGAAVTIDATPSEENENV